MQLSEHCWAFTAEGDPNTGVIIGDDSVMIIDATATPVAAQDVVRKVREITDKPIKTILYTHSQNLSNYDFESEELVETILEEVYNTERHLLYVACTRARDKLLVTGTYPISEFVDFLIGSRNDGTPTIEEVRRVMF